MGLPGTLLPAQPPLPPEEPRGEWQKWRLGLAGASGAAVLLVLVLRGAMGFAGGGSYEFLATQGDEPVTWDHCRAIRFHVNPKGAPEGWQDTVRQAVADVEKASGFVFMDLGTTTKTRLIGQRYDGNAWEPVLIMWSDRYQTDLLDGSVIGRGGGSMIEVNGRLRYVIGQVWVDSTVKDPYASRMVLEHELGHVLGLDHSSSRQDLMYAHYHGQRGLGSGDVDGLKRLHDVPCN
jgi:hypothetical protein